MVIFYSYVSLPEGMWFEYLRIMKHWNSGPISEGPTGAGSTEPGSLWSCRHVLLLEPLGMRNLRKTVDVWHVRPKSGIIWGLPVNFPFNSGTVLPRQCDFGERNIECIWMSLTRPFTATSTVLQDPLVSRRFETLGIPGVLRERHAGPALDVGRSTVVGHALLGRSADQSTRSPRQAVARWGWKNLCGGTWLGESLGCLDKPW